MCSKYINWAFDEITYIRIPEMYVIAQTQPLHSAHGRVCHARPSRCAAPRRQSQIRRIPRSSQRPCPNHRRQSRPGRTRHARCKESHGLSPGQISDPDRARRGVRRTSKKSAGDSVGTPPQRPESEEDIPRAAALLRRREQTSTGSCERGRTASSPPARFPAELLACGALAAGAAADVLRSGKPPGAGRRGRKTTGEDLA